MRMMSNVLDHCLTVSFTSLATMKFSRLTPSFSASSTLDVECESAYVSAPMAEAIWRARWPRPPICDKEDGGKVSEGFGREERGEKGTHADDANLLAGTATVTLEGSVDGDAGAQERGGRLRLEVLGDGDGELSLHPREVGVAALRHAAVLPLALIRANHPGRTRTMLLKAGLASVALEARAGLGADADALADLKVLDVGADANNLANDCAHGGRASAWSKEEEGEGEEGERRG